LNKANRLLKPVIAALQLTGNRYGELMLFILSVIDAFIFAMPVTTIFLVLVLMKEADFVKYVLAVLTGTITGALAGYTLGHQVLIKGEDFLTWTVQSIMDQSNGFSVSLYYKIRLLYKTWGIWILLFSAFTPFPYGIVAISSGLLNISLLSFFLITLISHAIKFTLIGFLIIKADKKIKTIQSRLKPYAIIESISIIFIILGIGIL